MGRRKIEMKKIVDKNSRQVTFSKRRSGLFNKATQLSLLCDAHIALIVFSNRGRIYDFSTPSSSSVSQVLKRYEDCTSANSQTSTITSEGENLHSRYTDIQTCTDLVKTVESSLDCPNVEQLSLDDFKQLEKQLITALAQTRTRKTELMIESLMSLQKQERMLKLENEQLKEKVATLKENENNISQNRFGFSRLMDAHMRHPRSQKTLPLLL